jgi:hypothetical protein
VAAHDHLDLDDVGATLRQRDTGSRNVCLRSQLDDPDDASANACHLSTLFGVFSILGSIDTIDIRQPVLQ